MRKVRHLNNKKKLVQINSVCNGSTGQIMYSIQKKAEESGWDTLSFVGRRKIYRDIPCEKFGNPISFWIHVAITTLFDRHGYGSILQTRRMIGRLREENPDVIHLHCIHGYYLHMPTLFRYLRHEYKGRIFWTFHDLWPITGHCPHYVIAECDKWKTECNKCPNKKIYPISWGLDQSRRNFIDKKKLFTALNNLEIVTPSRWMAEQIKQSFLKNLPVHVVSNGIDLNIFQYVEDSRVCEKYSIPPGKKIILGVASVWEPRKGLGDFLELAKHISPEYTIVLVGVSARQKKSLPDNVIGIQKTENKESLAAIYSRANVFLNPSKEESFSLVTIEAMACGTPVIALDTSAVKELVTPRNGVLLHYNDINAYLKAIEYLEKQDFNRNEIRLTVLQYSKENMAEQIIELYKNGE